MIGGRMILQALVGKSADADFVRKMIGLVLSV